jgi:23S rRNA (pseudouridine1915-N3)-methyltransferase
VRIKIICVGKIREPHFKQGAQEYIKRLRPYAAVELIEVKAEPDQSSPLGTRQGQTREAARIFGSLLPSDYAVALDSRGETISSEGFSKWLGSLAQKHSNLAFVIGGSSGLSPDVLARASKVLSLGPMTFPHQMVPVIILEQVYRAFMIQSGRTYHK